jgi:cytochrome d ubiquinol oxidase subunit I
MLAVSAWLRHGGDRGVFTGRPVALVVLVPAIHSLCWSAMSWDNRGEYQPMKIAAAERSGLPASPARSRCYRRWQQRPDLTRSSRSRLLSLLATNHWNGKVVGLDPLQQQYSQRVRARDYVPNVFIQYWACGDGLPGRPGLAISVGAG